MKKLICTLALASMALMVGDVIAENPENEGKRRRPNAQQRRGPGGPQLDPAKMVTRIMTEFDKDGDEKLDRTELTAWLKVMRERRGQGMRKGGKGRPGGPRGKRGSDSAGEAGGDVPVRPDA